MSYTNEQVTLVCYEAGRAIQMVVGDHTIPHSSAAPSWAIKAVAVQVDALVNAKAATPEDLHDVWQQFMRAAGWRLGALRAPERLEHPWLCPWSELPESARAGYRVVIAVYEGLSGKDVTCQVFAPAIPVIAEPEPKPEEPAVADAPTGQWAPKKKSKRGALP
jgi:hypothetical protein